MFFEKIKVDKSELVNHESHGKEVSELNKLIDTFKIIYTSKDNMVEKIEGYLNIPKNLKPELKLPVIVFLRGGSAYFAKSTDIFAAVFLSWLSSLGYVVITSNYRYKDEIGGKEINDILALEEIIKLTPEADSEDYTIVATSRGGINAYQILKEGIWKSKLKKMLIFAGVIDVNNEYSRRPQLREFRSQFYDVSDIDENDSRSVIKWVDKLPDDLSNIFIIHGTDDVTVHYENFLELKKEMSKFNRNPNFISVENHGHGLAGMRDIIKNILIKK
jgi:dipeptidyl aminopeptidase/acylaminoacyl peptidase